MRCGNCGNELRGEARFCSVCGAPVPQPSFSAPPQQSGSTFGDSARQPLSGTGAPRRKSGCGKILLVLLIIGLVVLAGVGIGGYYLYRFAEDKLKNSEAYTLAIERLKADPEVAERMGEIRETGFPLGSFQESADGTGSAVFRVSVTGAKASGNYDVVMARRERRWALTSGKVTLNNGETINVEAAGEGEETEGAEEPEPPAVGEVDEEGVVYAGALDAKVTSKPEPAYPAIARAARASGAVKVEVVVDERGRVTSARATSGHPLLRASAEAAARRARLMPTMNAGRAAKVRGTISYNFNAPPAQQ